MKVNVSSRAKKIGRLLICVLSLSAGLFAADPEIALSVKSIQGVALSSIPVGKPFTLIVAVRNATSLEALPQVEGFSKVHVRGHSTRMQQTYSMGVSYEEVAIQYTLVVDSPGVYTFGPARFDQFPDAHSGTVTVVAVKRPELRKEEYAEPKLTMKISKQKVFIGEKVPFTLRFTWQDPEVKPIKLEMPNLRDIEVRNMSKGHAKTERIGDQVYQAIEFTGEFYPQRPGIVRIPRLRADYSVPSDERRWSTFFAFSQRNRETAFTRPVKLEIQRLPKTEMQVIGIGSFKNYRAELSADEAPRGEAVTLTLSLEGDADFSQMKAPSLELPQPFRHYPSKSTPMDNGTGIHWDYIVQGLEEGLFTIPSQEITYFDPQTQSYTSLNTEELSLMITPGTIPAALLKKPEEQKSEPEPVKPVSPVQELPVIPFSLFMLLMLIPPLYMLCHMAYIRLRPWWSKFLNNRRAARALLRAKKDLKQLEKDSNPTKVHEVVKQALSLYLGLDEPSDDDIDTALKAQSYSQEIRDDVAHYLHEALQYSPYVDHPKRTVTKEQTARLFSSGYALLKKVSKALVIACVIQLPLQASVIAQIAQPLGIFPFIVWQLGVLVGWWIIWFLFEKMSSEMRYLTVLCWLCFIIGWALRAPYEYRPRAQVLKQTQLYVGPSENYPSRGVLETSDELRLVKKEGAWYYVSSSKGIGWVPADHLVKRQAIS